MPPAHTGAYHKARGVGGNEESLGHFLLQIPL